jgi:hypothetical protein
MGDVTHWLEQHGLGRYADAFADNDVDCDLLVKLTAEDLSDLGLTVGHRRRFLEAAAGLAEAPSPQAPSQSQKAWWCSCRSLLA